jgi:hypothetical protein
MKKLSLVGITLIILNFVFLSCQKEEDPDDPIVGTWEYTETSTDFSKTVTLSFYSSNTGLSTVDYIVFGNSESYNNNFSYSIKDGILTMAIGTKFYNTPYSISENQLSLKYLEEDMVLTRKLP